jgi:PAP2 superfamily
VIGLQAVWAHTDKRNLMVWGFAGASVLVASEYFGLNLLRMTEDPNTKVFDLYLLSFDTSLHVPVAFVMGQAFQKWVWLRLTGLLCYVGLFIPMAVVFAGQLVRNRQKALETLAAFMVAGPIGMFFYHLCPAVAAGHAFPDNFPWHPLSYDQGSRLFLEPIYGAGLRNAMPSLHMTWVLLAYWFSRGLSRWERAVAFFFATFTVVATMGTGEHYLIDLIVAFPFALMIQYLCVFSLPWRNEQRLRPFLFGLFATLTWLFLLRYETRVFWLSPAIPWVACILTVAFSVTSMKVPWRVTPAAAGAVASADA